VAGDGDETYPASITSRIEEHQSTTQMGDSSGEPDQPPVSGFMTVVSFQSVHRESSFCRPFFFPEAGISITPGVRSRRSVRLWFASPEVATFSYAVVPVTVALAACKRESTSANRSFFG
jgi:hypothetical protein